MDWMQSMLRRVSALVMTGSFALRGQWLSPLKLDQR